MKQTRVSTTSKQKADASERIALKEICRPLNADPRYVRLILRATGMSRGKGRWRFCKADAAKIETLIKNCGVAGKRKAKVGDQ